MAELQLPPGFYPQPEDLPEVIYIADKNGRETKVRTEDMWELETDAMRYEASAEGEQ